jgi:hypothetical protein
MGKLSRYGWIDRQNPEASGRCDGGGEIRKLSELKQQMAWVGNKLVWTGMMKCARHLDRPQEQDRLLVLPADPQPVTNPRPDIDAGFVDSALTYPDGTAVVGTRSSDWLTSLLAESTWTPPAPTLDDFTLDRDTLT